MISFISPFFSQTLAMHIAEGFLPKEWALIWYLIFLPFFAVSMISIRKRFKSDSSTKLLFALMAAFAFTLSSLKIPSLAGSCSHPTGMGLGAILLGPLPMIAIGTIVLMLQALLIAHGGITTLGANATSMAIVGPLVSYGVYRLLKKFGVNTKINVFLAAVIGDLMTYLTTSFQLGAAFSNGDLMGSVVKFMGVFMTTQLPIAIGEGLLTVIVFNLILESKQLPIIERSL